MRTAWQPPTNAWETTRVGRFGSERGPGYLEALRTRSIADPAWFRDAVVDHLGILFTTPHTQVLEPRLPMLSETVAAVLAGRDIALSEGLRTELVALVADQLGTSFRPAGLRFVGSRP